jgi:transcription elongation factor GreB
VNRAASTGPREPHYITRAGARRMQDELVELRTKQRPKIVQDVADAAAQGDRSENAEYIYGKKKLREIDRRIHYLTKRLETATVVGPADRDGSASDRVFFGATVGIEDEDGKAITYQIVGADEIDLAKGRISYRSPLGRALLKRQVGDTVVFKKPSGEAELTVVSISFD